MYFNEAIVRRIKEISEARHISYSRWAIKAQVIPTTLYDLQKQKCKYPKLVTLKKLCDAVHLTIAEFFDVDYLRNSTIPDEDWGGE